MVSVSGISRPMACAVGEVIEGQSAEAAGLEAGDIILQFGGTNVMSTAHFIDLVAGWGAHPASITVRRDGNEMRYAVRPEYDDELGRALIGVRVGDAETGIMPWMQFKDPWRQIRYDASQIFRILRALMTPSEAGSAGKGLGGPIMIFATLWAAIKSNLLNAIGFLRLVNVNLAILNLLPIPVLDGGHIIFTLWEIVTRRRPNPKVVNALVNVFAFFLIAALLLLSWFDIRRYGTMRRVVRERADELRTAYSNRVQEAEDRAEQTETTNSP
jgi:regulator of sigma E protease